MYWQPFLSSLSDLTFDLTFRKHSPQYQSWAVFIRNYQKEVRVDKAEWVLAPLGFKLLLKIILDILNALAQQNIYSVNITQVLSSGNMKNTASQDSRWMNSYSRDKECWQAFHMREQISYWTTLHLHHSPVSLFTLSLKDVSTKDVFHK